VTSHALVPHQHHIASVLEALSDSVEIETVEEFEAYSDVLRDVKTRRKVIATEEDKVTRPQREALAAARALFKTLDAQFEEAEKRLKGMIAVFDVKQKERERLALSAALASDNARALVNLAAQAAPVAQGVSVRTLHDFVIADPNLVPDEFWVIDEKKIGALVRASKGSIVIPGVQVLERASVSVRGR
jgi:hypothetical protein